MSDHPLYALSQKVLAELSPHCHRIEIAGGIRRQKPDPHDIEMVILPKLDVIKTQEMFGGQEVVVDYLNHTERQVGKMLESDWVLDDQVKRNGPAYKRLLHVETGAILELFITRIETWGYLLALRTGDKDFSRLLVTRALALGYHFSGGFLHQHPKPAQGPCTDWRCPNINHDLFEELDIFKALRMDWVDPPQRNEAHFHQATWKMAWEQT